MILKSCQKSSGRELVMLIKEHALALSIGRSSVAEIDSLNILQASLLAMQRAVEALPRRPQLVYVDGNHLPDWRFRAKAIVRGDAKIPTIAAASVLAKVTRDCEMKALDSLLPGLWSCKPQGLPYQTASRSAGKAWVQVPFTARVLRLFRPLLR